MDLLLDVDIIVDICAPREEYEQMAREAVTLCEGNNCGVWIYTGSVPALKYELFHELSRTYARSGQSPSHGQISHRSRELLRHFCSDKQWLAALSGEGDVFHALDPELEQLLQALDRFPEGSARLLTREEHLLKNYPEKAISPRAYLEQGFSEPKSRFVDLVTQQNKIRPALEHNIHSVFHHGKYVLGPEVDRLEERLAEYVQAGYCISCSSGTDALLMSLMACAVGPGDAVFTSPFTFVATAEVIALLGATPVFVDIDPHTFNMDPEQLEKAIQAVQGWDPSIYSLPGKQQLSPKCILPVDLFGLPADYDRINRIGGDYGLWVIEDAAQSLGAEYKKIKAGNLAHMGCTSFFPAKTLGAYGEGGAIFTQDKGLARELKSIRVHGENDHKNDNVRLGINGRLDSMQAAVLLAKMDIFPSEIELRREVANCYHRLLVSAEPQDRTPLSLAPPCEPDEILSSWSQYSLLAQNREQRDALRDRLRERGVPTAIYYPQPLHLQKAFSYLGYRHGDMPVSEDSAQRIFSLPMHPYLRFREQEWICKGLVEAQAIREGSP